MTLKTSNGVLMGNT